MRNASSINAQCINATHATQAQVPFFFVLLRITLYFFTMPLGSNCSSFVNVEGLRDTHRAQCSDPEANFYVDKHKAKDGLVCNFYQNVYLFIFFILSV